MEFCKICIADVMFLWGVGLLTGIVLTVLFYWIRGIWNQDALNKEKRKRVQDRVLFDDPTIVFRTPHKVGERNVRHRTHRTEK